MAEILDLVKNCGAANPPGIKTRLYVVCACDIVTFPDRLAFNAASAGDSVTLDGDIVLDTNKAFKILDIITKTGKVIDTLVGAVGSKSYENTLDGVIATTDADVLEWLEQNANGCFVVIAEEVSGQKRVIGTMDVPAYLETATADTGAASGDQRGATIQIKAETGLVASVYTGAIDLDPLT